MNFGQRIKKHQDDVVVLQKRRAHRLECVAQDLQHRRDMLDGDDLRSHANVLDDIDDQIAVAKALIQELQMLEIVCAPAPEPADIIRAPKRKGRGAA